MIDFRYHLVSIVAVFLALAIGIIIGTSAVQPGVISQLDTASKDLQHTNSALQSQNKQLAQQLATEQQFAGAAASTLVNHLLEGQRVVLITAPGADGPTISGITAEIQRAGGKVTGQVSLTPQFFDVSAANERLLTTLTNQVTPIGISPAGNAGQLSAQVAGQQSAAQLIAAAISGKDGIATITPTEAQDILNGFGQSGFLQISGPNGSTSLNGTAGLAAVVIPATAPQNASDPRNLALVAVADELARTANGALLAGSLAGSGPGSAIDAVNSGAAGVKLTTVDNADTTTGQIIVVQALRLLLNPKASPAAYGVAPNAVPSPIPTTPATSAASSSPSPSASKKKHG